MTGSHRELASALRAACDELKIDSDSLAEDSLRLVLAFMRIGDPAVRRAVMDIVERIPDRRGSAGV